VAGRLERPSAQQNLTDKHKRLRRTWLGFSAAVIAVVLLATLVLVKPAMPDRTALLTGPEGSAYHALGLRYAEDLGRRGLEVEVVVTEGAFDNLRQLAEGRDAVAFAPSTVDWESDAGLDVSKLVTLGSVGFEPVWLFYRSELEIVRIPDLAGRKVVSGGRGTASEHVARRMIEHNGLEGEVELEPLAEPTAEALADSLAAGDIDAAFATGAPGSPSIAALLGAEGVDFLSFERAEAYAGLFSGVTALVAPEGVFDLARNVPSRDAQLLATTTCLVAPEGIHPSVVPMLLVTAENVGQRTTTFSTTVAFPSSEHVTLRLDRAARRYFSQGETGLSRFLPYKVTRFLNHLGFLVLPLLTAVVVLLKLVPTGLRVWGGLRLKGWFKQLAEIEKGHAAGDDRSQLLADLDQIDRASAKTFVPRSAVHDYVDFRQFLHDMRERVSK